MNNTIKIGTRGSRLALYQANKLKDIIEQRLNGYDAEIVVITTKGDKVLDVALSKIGDKGVFTLEIENALYSGEIDVAVHSLKDLPTEMPKGLELGGVLERGDVLDALISKNGLTLDKLTKDHVIATSSLRRRAQLLSINPELNIIDIRGNVDTRIRKMNDGYCDATVMAATGLIRLGMEEYITQVIPADVMIPATCQGIIGIEIRENDSRIADIIKEVIHKETFIQAKAERKFLNTIQGGCQIPVGCYSKIEGDKFTITGYLASVEATTVFIETAEGTVENSEKISGELAEKILLMGGDKIMNEIRNCNH